MASRESSAVTAGSKILMDLRPDPQGLPVADLSGSSGVSHRGFRLLMWRDMQTALSSWKSSVRASCWGGHRDQRISEVPLGCHTCHHVMSL